MSREETPDITALEPPGTNFAPQPTAWEIAFFRDNGYLVVERLTTDAELAWIRERFEQVFDPADAAQLGAPVDRSGAQEPGAASSLAQAFFPEIRFSSLLRTAYMRNARRYAAALLGVDPSLVSSWGHMILKPAGGRAAPWHQDRAYWEPELDYRAVAVWLPMHEVSVEMGAMQFIPGSHRRGLLPHRHLEAPRHNMLEVASPFNLSSAVACPLPAGGATFHDMHTLHFTAPNITTAPRLAYPVEFQLTPVRRATPESMPWVDELRAARAALATAEIGDGRVTKL